MQLEVKQRTVSPGVTVLEFRGFLALGNQLMETERSLVQMVRQQPGKVVFDLQHVEAIDSAGVGMLLLCAGTIERGGGQMRVAGANARVRKIFEITHLAEVVPILDDLTSALASL